MESVIGETQPKSFVQQRRRSIVIDYLLATSTHGLRSVGRAYSAWNRCFWILIFMTAFGLMLVFVVSSIIEYFNYPTQTSTLIRLDRKMPFPAVTVCNTNPYRRDKLNESLVKYYYQQFPSNSSINLSVFDTLAIALIVDLFNSNKTEELSLIGFQLSDILLGCQFNGIDCSNSFTRSLTSGLGNCFTFNWKTSSPLFTLADFGNSFLLKEALQLTFYVPRESSFPADYFNIGINLLLHDNEEFPLNIENGLTLAPGFAHLITYRKSLETYLPHPYSACTSAVSDDLRALYKTTYGDTNISETIVYSESACNELCGQAYIFSQCACILPIPFFARYVFKLDGSLAYARTCRPIASEFACALGAKKQFAASDDLQTLWCAHCTSQCKYTHFAMDISAQAAPSDAVKASWATTLLNSNNTTSFLAPPDFAQRYDYYMNQNYLRVELACGSKYVMEYTQEPKVSFTDVFSSIGGQTGL
ncbi:unnamed protein product [Adineta ricciae]|uniref:Uncharacterized protein n=1 Tax=Adineta ricciae TaxID=249248 RepID=A0A814YIS3_ADIRI|nr:unnamed protein product [Adineta ricciae]CAF1439955.1 unnamed protein product [Adineta ricciae]